MKNSLEGFNNRYEMAEERTHEVQDGSKEIIQSEKQKEKKEEKWGEK